MSGKTVDAWNNKEYVLANRWVILARANASFYLVASEMPPVLTGTFSAPWNKGSNATVTVSLYGSTQSVTAKNLFANVKGSGSKQCAIAWNGTDFVLIAAECS